jgi:prepilin-type processing-associated H-X9-DG protein
MKRSYQHWRAFTLIELATVVALVGLLGTLLIPALARTKSSSQRIDCSNNLKQIGLAFQTWAGAHGDAFPMKVSTAAGGYSDYIGSRSISLNVANSRGVFGIYQVMSNELTSPKILICPAENEGRRQATVFSNTVQDGSNDVPLTNDLNTSYFVGVDALSSSGQTLLSGDHNLGSDGAEVPSRGFVTAPSMYSPDFKVSLGTNFTVNGGVGWLNTMHQKRGNVVMGDGSVQQFDRAHLQQALRDSSDAFGITPSFPNPIGCTGFGLNRIQFP